jgi:hypothetical protein
MRILKFPFFVVILLNNVSIVASFFLLKASPIMKSRLYGLQLSTSSKLLDITSVLTANEGLDAETLGALGDIQDLNEVNSSSPPVLRFLILIDGSLGTRSSR